MTRLPPPRAHARRSEGPLPSNAKLTRPLGPHTYTQVRSQPPPHCRATRLERTGSVPRRQRGGRVINRARPCVVWDATARAAGRRRDFDCNDRYRSPQRRRSGQGSKPRIEAGSRYAYLVSRDGATEARGRQANPGRGADAGAQRRPAARRARRVNGGTSRRRGDLTGVLTLSRWWGRGTDARGTKARAHTTPQDGPARGRRREHDDPGPGRRARASEAGAATARIGRVGCVTPLDRLRPGGHGGPGRTRRTRRDGSRRGIGQRGTQRLHGFGPDAG